MRQDFLDLFSVRSIKLIELLIDFLKPRVGSNVSYSNLARDLQVDPKTVQNWLIMLENIYAIFRITPYHKKIARSLLKEPKLYFYDVGLLCWLLGIKSDKELAFHPLRGQIFETMIVADVYKHFFNI